MRSIGFVRFKQTSDMWNFIKKFNALVAKPECDGRKMWASASRSPEDRKKGKCLSAYKRVLSEVGLAKTETIDYDSRRGILWIGRHRVGMWQAEESNLELDEAEMRAAGVEVSASMLRAAVVDSMSTK